MTIDTHHHMLPDFFWRETNDSHAPVGGLAPLQWSKEVFRKFVPGARVVKAFNHLDARSPPEPTVSGGRRVLFYSGDDANAKAEVRKIIEHTGYFAVDLGVLEVGGPLASLPFGPLASINFIKI